MAPGLDTYVWNLLDLITFPNGCHIAEVEVDPETGEVTLERYTAVDDFGTLINPMLTLGQVHGGVAQGIGQAMLEHTVYDPESGQMLSGSFMDYTLPRAQDLPDLDITLTGVPTKANPLGVKGSGQAGAIASPQAIIVAVLDALAPLGVTHIDMPATSERVWRAIKEQRTWITTAASHRGGGLSGCARRAWDRAFVLQPRHRFRTDRRSICACRTKPTERCLGRWWCRMRMRRCRWRMATRW